MIQACASVGVGPGPDFETVPTVKVKCFRTGGMIYQMVERKVAGKAYLRKMAVVIFHPPDEALFPPEVAKKVAEISGDCMKLQLPKNNAPDVVADLTDVASCMTAVTSRPNGLGYRFYRSQETRPRALGVLPNSAAQASFNSPCCHSVRMQSLSDSPAQVFSSGHVIANTQYRFGSNTHPTLIKYRITLFFFMLPHPIDRLQPPPSP